MNEQVTKPQLQDNPVNVKTKLALTWVTLMFFYIYNDIFSFYHPGHIADLVEGHVEGVVFTPTFLVGAAVLMAIPSLMILVSLLATAGVNRWVNIVVGALQLLVLIGTQFVGEGEVWLYWRIYEAIEAVLIVFIIYTAWKWPSEQA